MKSMVRNRKQRAFIYLVMPLMLIAWFLTVNVANADSTKQIPLNGSCANEKLNGAQWYYFETTDNGTVRIGLSTTDNVEFQLYSRQSTSSAYVITTDSNGYVELKAGKYYVYVTGTGTYTISANFKAAVEYDQEPNDTMETAIPLTSGVKVKGNAYNVFDDVDWYKLEIKTKSYISIKMNTNKQLVFVYDKQGTLIRGIKNDIDLMTMVNPGTYYIKMRSANPVGYYELTATIVEYPTENKITSAVYQGSGKVALTWSKSEYADGYYLFYKTSATGKWNLITTITSGNTTSYTHNYGPSAGQTYYYGIQAYRKDSNFGELINQEDAEGYKVSAPTSDGNQNNSTAKPSITSTSIRKVSGKAIEISWKVKGTASKYQIYRKASPVGKRELVKTIKNGKTLTWKDTSAKKGTYYSYEIIPYNASKKGKSAITSEVKLTGSLAKVTNVKAVWNTSNNTLSWKKDSLATGYKIYRKTGTGSYKLIKTTAKTSYKDTSVKKGKKYSYKIKAYYNDYTYNKKNGAYKTKVVLSQYSKVVSVKR